MKRLTHLRISGFLPEDRNSKPALFFSLRLLLACLLCLLFSAGASAQQNKLSCSMNLVPFINGGTAGFSGLTETHTSSILGVPWANTGNVIDASTSNAATATVALFGSASITVADPVNDYNAGNFAGFVLSSNLSLGVLTAGSTISTSLNGAVQETVSTGSLISLSLLGGEQVLGFYTNKDYDALSLTIGGDVAGIYSVYYPVMRGTGSCSASPALVCNTDSRPSFPAYAAVIDPSKTGVSGALSLGAITDLENLLDNDSNNYATIAVPLNLIGSASLAVKDVTTQYPAGSFAGFEISNTSLLDVSLLSNISVKTYRNDTLQETQAGTTLLVGAPLLSATDRFKIGFVTTQPFDEVQLVLNQPAVSVSLGTTRVYSAVLREFCAGPALACNTPVALSEAAYPVSLSMPRTGFSGAACAGCSISGLGNLLDGNPATGTAITFVAGAVSTGSIAVKDQLGSYAAGTFAGFNISNPNLLSVNVLANITVSTYLNGTLQESRTGGGLIAGVPSSLLGGLSRSDIGFVTTLDFDEVQLSLQNTVAVHLGTTLIHSPVVEKFCAPALDCNTVEWLTTPDQPVIVNSRRTGVFGVACVGCSVSDPEKVLTPSLTDYATLLNVAGVLGSTALSVEDVMRTYPAGTRTGFAVRNISGILDLNLLGALTLETYLDGTLQESRSGADLLELTALLPLLHVGSFSNGYFFVGFQTRQPFDEVRILKSDVVGVANTLQVYGAFVDTRTVAEVSPGVACPRAPLAGADHTGTLQGVPLTADLSVNDRDPQQSALTYDATPTAAPQHGTVTIAPNGSFTYTPPTGYAGRDSFAYRVCNALSRCDTAWVYISVAPPAQGSSNRPPQPQSDISETLVGVAVSGNLSGNDIEPDQQPLSYAVASPPRRGSLALQPDGSYTYTPGPGFVGTDTAVITVSDNGTPSLAASSLLIVHVYPNPLAGPGNHPPFAQNDVYLTTVGTPVSGNALANDSDPDGDPLTAGLISGPDAAQGTLALASDGTFTFTPAAGYAGGTVTALYRLCDNAGACDTATLTLLTTTLSTPLPVTLLTFGGLTEGCEAQLYWRAAVDDRFASFELQRSADGHAFRSLATLPAREGNGVQEYHYRLTQPEERTFYRLKLVEKNGLFSYSPVMMLRSRCDEVQPVAVFPNPTRGLVQVRNLKAGSKLAIYDLRGRQVFQQEALETEQQLNLSGLAPGSYQLVVDGDTQVRIPITVSR